MKNLRCSLRIITICSIIFIALLACRETTQLHTKKFDSKDTKIQMDIPQNWTFQSSVAAGESSTQYHEQYKRTDKGGFIDIETKFNQVSIDIETKFNQVSMAKPVSSAKIMATLIQAMKAESNLYKDLTILDESNDAVHSIVICRYIWGKKNELTYSLLAVSCGKEITKIVKVESWDQLEEAKQVSILTTVKNTLTM